MPGMVGERSGSGRRAGRVVRHSRDPLRPEDGRFGPPLPRDFYARPVLRVARECIGKVLVTQTRHGTAAGVIVESEAYRGPADRAAHSFGGRRTARTEVMFGPAGYAYVFLVYGMHWHF